MQRSSLAQATKIEELIPYREKGRHLLMYLFALLREIIEKIAQKSSFSKQIYFLNLEELTQLVNDSQRESLRKVAIEREKYWHQSKTLSLPAVIDSRRLENLFAVTVVTQGEIVQGVALSGGIASGNLVTFNDFPSGKEFSGSVVLTVSLDAGKFPLLVQASAIIVERGGLLSHGAILARQASIPVVLLDDAHMLLEGASQVEVNGNTGNVRIVEAAR